MEKQKIKKITEITHKHDSTVTVNVSFSCPTYTLFDIEFNLLTA